MQKRKKLSDEDIAHLLPEQRLYIDKFGHFDEDAWIGNLRDPCPNCGAENVKNGEYCFKCRTKNNWLL